MDIRQLAGKELGQYRLIELLGEGGMSAVYRGYQDSLKRDVAIKVLSTQLASEPEYIQRFNFEAKTVAALEHANIVPIFDYGTQDSLNFVAMRLLTGGTLEQRMKILKGKNQPLPSPKEVATLLKETSEALSYAHRRGIIHRDIKPGNIMFDTQGDTYIVDFGIAQMIHGDMNITGEGMTIGTPNFMAPEQWEDEELTPAVDQYALAIVVYYMLTGQLPFDASSNSAVMQKHLNEAPEPVFKHRKQLSRDIQSILDKALAKKPHDRYMNIHEFYVAFRDVAQNSSIKDTNFFHFPLYDPTTASTSAVGSGADTLSSPIPAPPEVAVSNDPTPPHPIPVQAPPPYSVSAPPQRLQPPPAKASNTFRSCLIGGGIGIILLLALILVAIVVVIQLVDNEQSIILPTATQQQVVEVVQPSPTGIQLTSIAPTPVPITSIGSGDINARTVNNLTERAVLHRDTTVPIRSIAYSPDGAFASGHGDGSLRIWRNNTPTQLAGHNGVIYSVAISPDGVLLASAGEDQVIRLWNMLTGDLQNSLGGHTSTIRDLAFSPDGKTLVSGAQDSTVRVWNLQNNTQQWNLPMTTRVLTVAFSPDGVTIAGGDEVGEIRIWNVQTGSQIQSFDINNDSQSVRGLAFSPDGSQLASGSTDNNVKIWNTANWQVFQTLEHPQDVWEVAFSPDGALVVSGNRDNTARIWDVQTGQQLKTLEGHAGWVLGVAFNYEGSILSTGGGDGTIRLWTISD